MLRMLLQLLSWKSCVICSLLLVLSTLASDRLLSQNFPAPPAEPTPTENVIQPQQQQQPAQEEKKFVNPVPPVSHPTYAPAYPRKPAPAPASKEAVTKQQQQLFEATSHELNQIQRPSLVTQGALLALMSLLPFIIMNLTAFLKVVVVLSLLRTALGVQQAPPNQIINGVAFLLSLFIMYPTGVKMYEATQEAMKGHEIPSSFTDTGSSAYIITAAKAASEPLKDFLKRNSSVRHQGLFYRLIYRGLPESYRESLKPDDMIVLVPAYITGQLKDAFEIGVLIYIPFFVIDLVTSNILLAMGMMMLSPVTISMPLKLFLLVMLDGWTVLIEGLVKTFI